MQALSKRHSSSHVWCKGRAVCLRLTDEPSVVAIYTDAFCGPGPENRLRKPSIVAGVTVNPAAAMPCHAV
ncbi:hypothetical protein HOE425_331054 [Hoeflea sp. EC-HK425]|nr:hypothetical protein HOE425_331054 [Hoeflea sp. EC-HK425]